MGGQNATLLSGVACQPYSSAGDQRGGKDERSSSLPFTLDCAWKLQSPLVVIECTPKAMTNEFVQSQLKKFCHQCGYHMTQSILHLDRCWSAHRTRWWCVLSAAPIGAVSFADLPLMPEFRAVKNIMPYIRQWPIPEVNDLTLSLYEHSKFQAYGKGVVSNLLNVEQVMPTALHSWGNQCYPCACGCRPGFSEFRLHQKGLFGLLIPGDETIHHENETFPKCRHVHPSEVALLSGAFPNIDWKQQVRLGLAVTGQMASPLQACWIGSHVMKVLQQFTQSENAIVPEDALRLLQTRILKVRDQMWPSVETPQLVPTRSLPLGDGTKYFWVSKLPCGNPIRIAFHDGAKISQLLEAENEIGPIVSTLQVFDEHGSFLLPEESIQDGTTYYVGSVGDWHSELNPLFRKQSKDGKLVDCHVLDLPMEFLGAHDGQSHEGSDDQHDVNLGGKSTNSCGSLPVLEIPDVVPMHVDPPVDDHIHSTGGFPHDALCQVGHDGLLAMLRPCIASDFSVACLQSQQIPSEARLHILKTQGTLWADDELRFHLQALALKAPIEQCVVVWDPLLVSSAFCHHHLPRLPVDLKNCQGLVTVVTVVQINQHWIPILWRKDQHHLLGFVANVSEAQLVAIQDFHCKVCAMWGFPITKVANKTFPRIQDCCGVIAIEFLRQMIQGNGSLLSIRDDFIRAHHDYRKKFEANLTGMVIRPWLWGNGQNDDRSVLANLLKQHGVPEDAIAARIDMLFKKLGREEVLQTATGHQPWRDLKWLANQQIPPLQIIRPLELEQAIAAKSESQQAVGRRHQKGRGKGAKNRQHKDYLPNVVDPSTLRLEEGTFVLGDGTKLSQMQLTEIGPIATGVVLAKYQDAMPFIMGGKAVSTGGLALVVVDPPFDSSPDPIIAEKISFPVICAANSEPMIIEAALYQLGHLPVTKAIAAKIVKLKSIDTCTAKVSIFRDQAKQDWTDVMAHPLKYLLARIPLLTLCNKAACDSMCGSWHVPEGTELKDPLLEVWNRQWLTMAFSQVPPKDADVYSVTLRIPKSIEQSLQHYSGIDGIYIEPKAIDGRQVSKEFHVVWVPKASYAQIAVHRQTVAGVIGIARIAGKYGLRCLADDSQNIHSAVKPDSPYLPSGTKLTFLVGPVPWGTLKQSLVSAFKELNWEARPLQAVPAGRDFNGVMWKVHALEVPPQNVLYLDTGEAVITRVDQKVYQPTPSVKPVLGSIASVNLATRSANGQSKPDPIQLNDPWAAYNGKIGKAPAPAVVAPDAISALEKKITSSVIAQLPKDNMELDGDFNTVRVDRLESQVQVLHDQQAKLQSLINDNAATQQAQLVQLQSQFQAQHSQLESVVTEQSHQICGLSSSFSQQLEKQQKHLDYMFQAQMQKMEDLLSKKPRRE